MFGLGTPELIVILLIAVVVFGAKKLPELGQGLGKAISSFKKEMASAQHEGETITKDLPGVQEVASIKEKVQQVKDLGNILK